VIEQGNQLLAGERPLAGVGLRVRHVHRGVPLVHDLHRVSAKALLTLDRPLVRRVDDVAAERAHRLLVIAQRGALEVTDRAAVAEPLIDQCRGPVPRQRIGVPDECLHRLLAPVDRGERQVAGQLLVAPAIQHRGEHLLLGP
jgi:hypothetical protein